MPLFKIVIKNQLYKMATSRKGAKENPVTDQDKVELEIPEYVIIGAKLNDGKQLTNVPFTKK